MKLLNCQMSLSMTAAIGIKFAKCRYHGLVIIPIIKWAGRRRGQKQKTQMSLSKTAAIKSNSNPQFVIAAFELLKEKTLSRTTAFAKHTSLGISLAEPINTISV